MKPNERSGGGDLLLEPLSAYKKYYGQMFRKNCNSCFDRLMQQAGLNAEANRRTVSAYESERKNLAEIEGKLSKYKRLKGLLIALIVLGAVLCAVGVLCFIASDDWLIPLVLLFAGVACVLCGALLRAKKIKPLLEQTQEKQAEHRQKADALLSEAWAQMTPLNDLFEDRLTKQLIRETVPALVLDDCFDVRRYDYLNGKYGYGKEDDPAASTLGVVTGEISGNPFVEDRRLLQTMGTQVYTGSITIHWTTTHTDSEGHTVTEHHSQTLTASVTKPKPFYRTETRLIYGNEAAPGLHFSRAPAHAEDLSEKARARKVKKGLKSIRKKQAAAMGEGGSSFTEMGNSEFDVLFGALDRDNEVEFRLLFTPLAQKNLLALLTDAEGFGDDFRMIKDGCLNYILSEHAAGWDMREDRTRYASYSVDLARKSFLDFNEQYFRSLYFDLAPLLSIPLYTQQKPQEYLYRGSERSFTRKETEFAVNNMDPTYFAPRTAATKSILKTTFLDRDGKSDRVRVTANAFEAHEQVDYVSEWGGDGYLHEIPVPWVEYVPVSETRVVKLKEIGLSDRDFSAEAVRGKYRAAMQKYGQKFGYGHGILCCLVDDADDSFDKTFE